MNKMFIEVEPILIPIDIIKTQPKDCMGLLFKNQDNVLSHLTDLTDIINANAYFKAIPQHLHLISDYQPAYRDDYYYNASINAVVRRLFTFNDAAYAGYKKSYASTNNKLGLPGIPDTLMKELVNFWHKTHHLPPKLLIEVEHSDLEEEKKKHGTGPENLHKISLSRLKLTEDNKVILPSRKTFSF